MLPARSQVVRRVHIASKRGALLVPNQEIQPGIYIANTIVQGNNAYVRILNTNSCDTALNTMEIITEDLSDYDIIWTTEESGNRFERVIDKLKKNFPDQFKDTLTTLCTEYSDIFALETETVTTNNFYKQKLRLSDRTPSYIKNYRIPHAHKAEVNRQVKKLVDDGIVEPSTSNYNSPLLLVPKKSLPNSKEKRWRLVIDYRQVNKKLIADKFPLPTIEIGRAHV